MISKEIVKLPKYCLFKLNRFEFMTYSKNNKFIEYPESLEMSDNYNIGITYELKSFAIHSGTFEYGHYTAVAKKNDSWVYFSDSFSSKIRKEDALNQKPYILVYQRV